MNAVTEMRAKETTMKKDMVWVVLAAATLVCAVMQ